MAYWGVDLGGTKIEGVILQDPENPEPIARIRIPTEAAGGYDHIINRIKLLIDRLSEESGLKPERIGIGTPGAIDPSTGLLKNSNTTSLNGKPLKTDLEKKLGIPATMANDANCFALAETRLGVAAKSAPGAEVIFGVIMGTGVGGGLVVNGKVINGLHSIAGEWGHNFLDNSGGRCYCGKTGCVETILAGPALEKHYKALTGRQAKLKHIVEMHERKTDPHATLVMQRLTAYFGKAIAAVINLIDPDAVILGGGLGNINLLYSDGVKEAAKYTFNNRLHTAFLKPDLGDSAGVFGAAMLTA